MTSVSALARRAAFVLQPLTLSRTKPPALSRRPPVRCLSQPPLPAPPRHSAAVDRCADPDATCVIIGASRGIGLAMTQQIFGRFKGRIVALCRNPTEAHALSALFQFNPHRMHLVPIDTTVETSVAAAAAEVKALSNNRVDVLLHTVGLLHDGTNMPETSLARVDSAFLEKNLLVNTLGPILVLKHFTPLMVTARKPGRVPSVFATLTARVGSISDNALGGWMSYRASKAAQNMAVKTASIELGRRGIVVAALHPGTCDTELSGPFQKNVPKGQLFPVDMAATQLLDVVDSLGPEDNGGFFDYARKTIQW